MKHAEKIRQRMRMESANKEADKAFRENRCPSCAETVKLNLSLTGWVQCVQFGAEGFRKDATRPSCNWQGFRAEVRS